MTKSVEIGVKRVKSGEWRCGYRRKRLFELKIHLQQGCGFVGNGLDRSVISVFIAILYKIRIEYNIMRFEPEQASLFPTTSLQLLIPNSSFLIPNY